MTPPGALRRRRVVEGRLGPFFENKKNRADHEAKAHKIIPLELFLQVKNGKHAENHKGNHFLDCFQLRPGKLRVTPTIGRYLETILKKGNQPANNDDFPKGRVPKSQVSVPSESHEDIREEEKDNSSHEMSL
jgi:hypothetical protein